MLAGTLSRSGYFMGNELWPARNSNPKGFFEDKEINMINEDILDPIVPRRKKIFGIKFFKGRPEYWDRWLTRIPLKIQIPPASTTIKDRIITAIEKTPYCFKDPRFSYTLPVWKPFLKNDGYICVFREPANTAISILKECNDVPKLRESLNFSFHRALQLWILMYERILTYYDKCKSKWLFIHFDQLINGSGFERVREFTGTNPDQSFIDPMLRRSISNKKIPRKINEVYNRLCKLAEFE
jgi:hypothetical protein